MDLRRHKRYAVRFPVSLLTDSKAQRQPLGTGTVFNLSASGCKIESASHVETGDYVKLELHIPGKKAPIQVNLASVRWAMGQDFGLEFIAIQSEEHERLLEYIRVLENETSPLAPKSETPSPSRVL